MARRAGGSLALPHRGRPYDARPGLETVKSVRHALHSARYAARLRCGPAFGHLRSSVVHRGLRHRRRPSATTRSPNRYVVKHACELSCSRELLRLGQHFGARVGRRLSERYGTFHAVDERGRCGRARRGVELAIGRYRIDLRVQQSGNASPIRRNGHRPPGHLGPLRPVGCGGVLHATTAEACTADSSLTPGWAELIGPEPALICAHQPPLRVVDELSNSICHERAPGSTRESRTQRSQQGVARFYEIGGSYDGG